ncbi:hypothetical protein CYY_005318 [Polysphondylium violaceum]|uniref:Polyketide synthase n=1 Tax=Polysphondylium violaceum TaxID=133409 RepID=A0A8J4PT54_9MYCE|nr:hypothetical protein CYY_005318 [Polysphondylium violaceum]
MYRRNRVAIVGLGLRLPKSKSPQEFWCNLVNKFDGISQVSKERFSSNFYEIGYWSSNRAGFLELDEWLSFDPLFFGISPSDAAGIDPQQRLLLKVVYEALQDAHIDPQQVRGTNTSVYIGCCSTDYKGQLLNYEKPSLSQETSIYAIANRISHTFDFRGPSMTIDTACSSSMSAFSLGFESIERGDSDLSVVGGVGLLFNSEYFSYLSGLNALSPDGECKSFDASANGFARAEGSTILVLKNLDRAIQDGDTIYSVVEGVNSNSDGNFEKGNFHSPSASAQSENLYRALSKGNINPSDVYYFECHGTGTIVGDKVETSALSKVFKDNHSQDQPLLIGSVKSNIGHTEGNSGACGIAKVCLMMKNKTFVPNIHFNTPNPNIDFDNWNLKVVTECTPFPLIDRKVVMGINSFGITGSNGCVFLSEYKAPTSVTQKNINETTTNSNNNLLVPISSNSKQSMDKYLTTIMDNDFISDVKDKLEFNDFIRYHILSKPTQYIQRSVLSCTIQDGWNNFSESKVFRNEKETTSNMFSIQSNPKVVFVYCGQGPQWNQMGLNLYEKEPTFKKTVDLIDDKLGKHFGYSVWNKLLQTTDELSIHDPLLAQPSMFILQCALTELYKQWRVIPDIVTGHSFGEITSLYYSGIISLDSACKIVYERARLQQKTVGSGRMLALSLSKDDFDKRFKSMYPDIEIACFNSNNSNVISGSEANLLSIKSILDKDNIFCAFLGTRSSFHSSSQESIKNEFFDSIDNNLYNNNNSGSIMFSTTTSNQITKFSTQLLYDNLRNPVLFSQTIHNISNFIEDNTKTIFIEISPHPTLSRFIKEIYDQLDKKNITIINPLNKKSKDQEQLKFNETISNLYINGYDIDFSCQYTCEQLLDTTFKSKCQHLIPPYQWDDEIYYKESDSMKRLRLVGPSIDCLGNPVLITQIQNSKAFKTVINTDRNPFSYLKGHMVDSRNYFPGCGYIDNIMKAFTDSDHVIISRLEFKQPLILKPSTDYELHTTITQVSKNEHKAEFHFSANNKWINSATGKVIISPPFTNRKLDFSSLQSKCNLSTVYKTDIYQYISATTGLTYVDQFQRVEEANLGDGCSLSKISIKPRLSNNDTTLFNPAILDSCLHGIFPLAKGPLNILFDRISNMKIYTENIKNIKIDDIDFIYAFTDNLQIDKIDNRITSSLKVMLDDGTLLFEILQLTCLSLTPIKSDTIKYPNKELYSLFWQSIESLPMHKWIADDLNSLEPVNFLDNLNYQKYCSLLFYNHIKKKAPSSLDKSVIQSTSINDLINHYLLDTNIKSKYSNLFRLTFKVLQENPEYMVDDESELNRILESIVFKDIYINYTGVLKKSIPVIASLLFPSPNLEIEDTQKYVFDDDEANNLYLNHYLSENIRVLCNNICKLIKENIKEKRVVRIIELGSGTGSLTSDILKSLHQLLIQNEDHCQIQIEFTYSDISSSFISQAKSLFGQYSDKINIIYTTVDIESDFLEKQQLKGSYYDFIVLANVMHFASQASFPLQEIYKILSYGGHLLFLETITGLTHMDFYYGAVDQWTGYKDTDIRSDHYCMNPEQWKILLEQIGYTNICSTTSNHLHFVMYGQKPLINDKLSLLKESTIVKRKVIIFQRFTDENSGTIIDKLSKHCQQTIVIANHLELKRFISEIHDDDIIINLSILSEIDKNSLNQVTMEFIEINQEILKKKSRCKHILLSLNSLMDSKYYLNASVVGASRYFNRFNDCVLIDFDQQTLQHPSFNIVNMIELLMDSKSNNYKEFAVRNCIPHIELAGKELIRDSPSYENNDFYATFKLNFSLKLSTKLKELSPYQVEVEIKASGINFRDNLVYRDLVSQQFTLFNGEKHFVGFGGEMTALVTRIGEKVSKVKVGDRVCGIVNSFTNKAMVNEDELCILPDSISYTEGATIPVVYLTVYYSILRLGRLFDDYDKDESTKSILIHSATGGVGLSALNLLKWKMKQTGIKVYIFVTVGTKEKQDIIKEKYGSMVTGIFSSLNTDFVDDIKNQLLELGSTRGGVDVILNTTASEFMHSNFSTLAQDGKMVDLSVTHLYNNEFLDFNNFRHNISYITTDVSSYTRSFQIKVFNEIVDAISKKELDLIPVTVFPIDKLKDALEFIGERKHIGKLVVEYDKDIVTPDVIKAYKNKVLKNDYQIQTTSKCVIITGQQGLVLETLNWLISNSNSITDVIILTRSTMKWEIRKTINQYKSKINFHFRSIDIGNYEVMESTFKKLYNNNPQLPPVDCILHFAYLHTESEPLDITLDEITAVHNAKTMGLLNLHELSLLLKWDIKHFIISSSIIVLNPTYNQCAYISANLVYDSFSKYRRSLGLECSCLIFGPLEGAGYVSRKKSVENHLSHIGYHPLPLAKTLGSIDLAFSQTYSKSNLITGIFNFSIIKKNGHIFPHFEYYTNHIQSTSSAYAGETSLYSIRDKVINTIADLLSISPSKLNSSMKFKDYGVDSLFMVQLKNWIEKEFNKPNIISVSQLQNSTIDSIIERIQKNIDNNNSSKNKITIVDQKDQPFLSDLFIETHPMDYWQNEIKLDEKIRSDPNCKLESNQGRILLTGATGFLGSYLLTDLLHQKDCKIIYCPIRANSTEHAKSRIIESLSKYKLLHLLNENDLENRIIPIVSDLNQESLGLNQNQFNNLAENIDIIIHCAATVHFNVFYSDIKDKFMLKELLKLIASNQNRLIRFLELSSTSVYLSTNNNNNNHNSGVNENKIPSLDEQNTKFGYAQSKVVQEYILNEAYQRGIPCVITRPPFIFPTDVPSYDSFQLFFFSCLKVKKCPILVDSKAHVESLKVISSSICKIAMNDKYWIKSLNHADQVPQLNLISEPIQISSVIDTISKTYSYPMIDFEEWKQLVAKSNDPICKKIVPFLPGLIPAHMKKFVKGKGNQQEELVSAKDHLSTESIFHIIEKNNI